MLLPTDEWIELALISWSSWDFLLCQSQLNLNKYRLLFAWWFIAFAINIFEAIWTRFSFEGFKSGGIDFEIGFAISCHISIVFNLVRFIVFLTFRPMNITCEYSVFSSPVGFALGNTRIYINTSDYGNVLANIKVPVD